MLKNDSFWLFLHFQKFFEILLAINSKSNKNVCLLISYCNCRANLCSWKTFLEFVIISIDFSKQVQRSVLEWYFLVYTSTIFNQNITNIYICMLYFTMIISDTTEQDYLQEDLLLLIQRIFDIKWYFIFLKSNVKHFYSYKTIT